MKRNLLLTPGPTQIPPELCAALGKPIIHHRTPQFQQALKDAITGLKYVYQTTNDIYILAGSGTAGMEAAVCNLLSAGDKAITVEAGKFGERWTELCKAYGADPQVIEVEWGKAVQAEQIKDALKKQPETKAVFITLNETSTAVLTDVKAIGAVVRETNAVLVVDAVSGLGVVDLQTDNWHADVVVAASHKGFMLPPGVAFVSASPKAIKQINASTSPRYYFDLRKAKKVVDKPDTPFTPAIGIIVALVDSVKFFQEKGLENIFHHYARLAEGVRAAARGLGLSIFTDESCLSNVLTAINIPGEIDGTKIVKLMRDTYGISVAGGQAQLKGKIIRIAHMGALDEFDLLTGICCLEKVLKVSGYSFKLGAGVSAAQEIYNK
ncbi:MAG: alanine--glyoxylate aminotransferase family protein [Candidatus Omnitrophica bacterium]|nr:alanine--glyoxylate aminotransferase family protein [Candidatus Omnitrophota bacterium]